ncbi:BRO-N domain-containing protein [Ectopseudomonas oleovorans]|uniref:BRO-N domain-containing protein n=1 Tax=Ectopseudomonas oleovorans TaxID=301 RepID=UPI0019D16506|nr:Bro-N domain-containing protein [Pseudomonas oleovorans]
MHTAQVIPFRFESREVRTLLIDDQPWFVASDVALALMYSEAKDMTRNLDDDEKGRQIVPTLGGEQEMLVINESGLYSAILRSRKAEAKRFKKWITAEVLPAIRKHGRYEDSRNNLGTLIGETIGTNGFNMLGALVKGKVAQLPTATQRRATAKIWSQTHAAFGVRSAADIPADQLDAARNFIAAYALEGEWLGRAETGSSLSRNDALAVEALVNDAEWLVYLLHRCGVVDHLRAVESPLAGSMAGRVESTSISHKLVRSLFADQLEAAAAWADELCGRPALRLVKGALPA